MSLHSFHLKRGLSNPAIAMWITADYSSLEYYSLQSTSRDYLRKITESLFLEVNPRIFDIKTEDIEYLALGLSLVAEQLGSLWHPEIIFIRVIDMSLSLADFRTEGMAYAIVEWAVQEFGLTYTLPPITFDKQANRYLFPF